MDYKMIWSSYGEKNMNGIPRDIPENAITIVINANNPTIEIVEPVASSEAAVKSVLRDLTAGCNYRYDIIAVVGNSYFCN